MPSSGQVGDGLLGRADQLADGQQARVGPRPQAQGPQAGPISCSSTCRAVPDG